MKIKTIEPATIALFFAISLLSCDEKPFVKVKNMGTLPIALSITNRLKKAMEKSPKKEDKQNTLKDGKKLVH